MRRARQGDMRVETFKDLECWKLADELKQAVHAITARPPISQDRDFCTDIRRSARSVPSNIAEGFGRFDHGEFGRYLSIALGSLAETGEPSSPCALDRFAVGTPSGWRSSA
jgi:hypothetical protein